MGNIKILSATTVVELLSGSQPECGRKNLNSLVVMTSFLGKSKISNFKINRALLKASSAEFSSFRPNSWSDFQPSPNNLILKVNVYIYFGYVENG